MVTWKTFDSKGRNIFLAFLMPSITNLFIDEMPQRSIRVANCKNRYRRFDFVFDTAKPFSVKKKKPLI